MGPRHLGRELALKALYQIDISGGSTREDLALMFENFQAGDSVRRFAAQLVEGVERERADLDRRVAEVLEHWSMGRLPRVDLNILRLALFELMQIEDVPARVTIDEAIELAKTYGDKDSGRFVNGVLDRLADRLGLKGKGEERSAGKAN